jgi:hypothetical protein
VDLEKELYLYDILIDLGARGMNSEELDTQRFNGWSLTGNIACEK